MVWTVVSDKSYKEKREKEVAFRAVCLRRSLLPTVVLLLAGSAILYYFLFIFAQSSEEEHVILQFEDRLLEVCREPKLPKMEYTGVESFFKYLQKPETEFCYSWIEFGGEKIPVASQTEKECQDEVRKAKFMCFNEEYKMNRDPCLVYSFDMDLDSQFERDMHLFSCEVHAFDHEKVEAGEHVRRSEFWFEHAWEIAEYPYNLPAEENPSKNGRERLRRSLDFITTVLRHKGQEIKYIKSDLQGREWMLLRQIVTYNHFADIRQIGLRLHIPTKTKSISPQERHDLYLKLFQAFQGLTCLGYRLVMVRPIKYYKGGVHVPEMNKTFFPAYEVNFVRDLNI